MDTTIVEHPLLTDIITRVRDKRTEQSAFVALIGQATGILLVEATARLQTAPTQVTTPVATADGALLVSQPLLLPVLRAGLTMLDAARRLLPAAPVGFAGLRRNEETAEASWYLESLPEDLKGRDVIVLEPMVATGGTLVQVAAEVVDRGATTVTIVSMICSEPGLAVLRGSEHAHLLRVVAAACDSSLTTASFIAPGLGDAGDRAFGWA